MFQQREELNSIVKNLQGEKRALVFEIDCLNGEKERLETAIGTDKTLLQKKSSAKTDDLETPKTRLVHHKQRKTNSQTPSCTLEEYSCLTCLVCAC